MGLARALCYNLCWACALASPVTFLTGDHVMQIGFGQISPSASSTRDLGTRLTMKLIPAKCHERTTLRKLTSNGKQFSVTHEMLTAVARDQRRAWCCRWNLCAFLLYNKSLDDWSLGEQWILFLSNPETKSRETLRFSGNKIHCSHQDQSLRPHSH